MIDVDSQDAAEQIGNVLACRAAIGRIRPRAVARGNIQIAVGAKFQAARVVAAGRPGHDYLLAAGNGSRRVVRGEREPREAGVTPLARMHITQEQKVVAAELRMQLGVEERNVLPCQIGRQ